MWYSWDEMKRPIDEEDDHTNVEQHRPDFLNGIGALPSTTGTTVELPKHPGPKEIQELWTTFVTNVHPLVKIFFAWEQHQMLNNIVADPTNCSRGEAALAFAIYFIAVLSMSEHDCKELFLGSSKPIVLDKYQAYIEAALLSADYTATSDLRVLQALVLYMVSLSRKQSATDNVFS